MRAMRRAWSSRERRTRATWVSTSEIRLEKERDAERRFEVVGRLLLPQQIDVENVIANVAVHGEPIERHQSHPDAEIDREPIVAGELRLADPADDVGLRVHRAILTDEVLARENVVAERHVIVGILALGFREQLRSAAQTLEARELGVGFAGRELDEEAFRDVIGESPARDRVDAEVLDADLPERNSDLEVLGVDLRHLDLAPGDVRLDDRRLRGILRDRGSTAGAPREASDAERQA